MFDILFKNATVITMTEQGVLYNAYCGVAGGKISYLSKIAPTEEAIRTIDVNGNILMPGLINCHTHTAMTVLRGLSDDSALNDWLFNHIFPAEARLDERSVNAGFVLGCAEMLASGTTAFCDMYFYSDKMAKVVDKIGMRANMSNGVIALSDDYVFEKDRAVTELCSMLSDESLSERVNPQAAVHCERTSPEWVWKKVVEIAKANNLTMHIHLSETETDQNDCLSKRKKTPTQVLSENGVFDVKTIAAHCVHLTEDDMDILAKKGVSAVHCPVSNLKLASGIADVVKLREHGVNVALGTDGCSSNNTLDMFEDMKLAALLAKNSCKCPERFTAHDALCMATVNGAKAMGIDDRVGVIRVGFDADIILIDIHKIHRTPMYDAESTVVYCLGGNDVYLTMVCGKILYENGEFKTLDVDSAIKTINGYVTHIVKGEQ